MKYFLINWLKKRHEEWQETAWPTILEMSMEEQMKYTNPWYFRTCEDYFNSYYMNHDGVYFFDGDNLSTHSHVLGGLKGRYAVDLIGDMAYLLSNISNEECKFRFEKITNKKELVKRDYDEIVGSLQYQEKHKN